MVRVFVAGVVAVTRMYSCSIWITSPTSKMVASFTTTEVAPDGQGAAVVHRVGTGPVVVVGHQELRRAGGQLGQPREQRRPVDEPVDRDAEDVVGNDPGVERRELGQRSTFIQRHG